MAKKNYRQIPALVEARKEFVGNTMQGLWAGPHYLVYSYSTIIAVWTPENGWEISNTKHSMTTSRHQNIVRRVAVG